MNSIAPQIEVPLPSRTEIRDQSDQSFSDHPDIRRVYAH